MLHPVHPDGAVDGAHDAPVVPCLCGEHLKVDDVGDVAVVLHLKVELHHRLPVGRGRLMVGR